MKYLVWGTGSYCKGKIRFAFQNFDDEVLGFVDRKRGSFYGKKIIMPSEIQRYNYDKIVVFSRHYLEIIKELIAMGIKSTVIIPGIACRPLMGEEIQLMTDHSRICVTQEGTLDYSFRGRHIIVSQEEDWEIVKKIICSEENIEAIKTLSVNPVSRVFGIDRGKAVDRYYIESFLYNHSKYIKGDVLEMGEDRYTKRFGAKDSKSHIFVYSEEAGVQGNRVYGDLEDSARVPEGKYDCIIFTQVFNFIWNVSAAIKNSIAMLKEKGVLLVTVAGNTPVSRYDMDRWGHYWNFTYKSVEKLCDFDNTELEVCSYGNCKVACGFLQGMSVDDLEPGIMDYCDNDYPIVICACVRKVTKNGMD